MTILARTASAYIGGVGAGGLILCLTGDVMTGRGVDQILPAAGDPRLWEHYAVSARSYVELAEAASGPIPQPVDFSWPWGDALPILDEMAPDLRIVNLETSVTRSDDHQAGKAVLYRMSPGNVACLTAARLDACALANNHVLDFGMEGLEETLDVLTRAGLGPVGAGRDAEQAWLPRVLTAGGHRVLLWSVASPSSGVPGTWAAGPDRAGVAFLNERSDADADALCERVRRVKQPGDIAVVSVHWGSNWGYAVRREQVGFAHRLVDSGVDVVHGHSSHHPRPIEVYRDRLVLYGCGDLINDYEGIAGEERFRGDLRLLYVARLDPTGRLDELRMVPLQSRQMRLQRATDGDTRWVQQVLRRISRGFGSRVDLAPDGNLLIHREVTR
jgi:poly-gamma-glutamate capsule biosynthesis protein CapA/YwtB (metallophosphatase superfamily)